MKTLNYIADLALMLLLAIPGVFGMVWGKD
jgi:hypothetical protein